MENRRQLAMQRKAEEEKSRAQEQERKLKEEGERRKREREEHTDKRPLKAPSNKKVQVYNIIHRLFLLSDAFDIGG